MIFSYLCTFFSKRAVTDYTFTRAYENTKEKIVKTVLFVILICSVLL